MRIRTLVALASLLATTAMAGACGGGDSFSETEVPQLTLDQSTSQNIQLRMPRRPDEAKSQTPIKFRNTGEADLEVTNVEWVSNPPRLIGAGDYTGASCTYDPSSPAYDSSGTCEQGTFCWFHTSECRVRGLPESMVVEPQQIGQLDIVLLPGETVDCPAAPTDRQVPPNYCGELLIETNANNNSDTVTDGNVRIFFTHAPGSGEIAVSTASISFSGVSPGGSDSREITITNTADEGALEIERIGIQENGGMFDITGAESAPTEIEPGAQKSWTVTFNAPSDWDQETIGTNLEILSSGTNERETLVPVTVSNQQDLPAIKLDPQVLRFDESTTQTLTISNEGAASLTLQDFTVRPSQLNSAYSFLIEGVSTEPQFPSDHKVIRAGESKEVTVEFTAPSTGSGIATFEVGYSYYVNNQTKSDTANATLLGTAGDSAVGMITPSSFTFRAASGNSQTRNFVIRNVGTEPLEISEATFSANTGSADDFTVTGATGTIPEGGIQEATLTYEASDDQMDNVTLTLASNTAGEPMSVLLFAEQGVQSSDVAAKITPSFANDTTPVGEEARFSARQSTGTDQSMIDSATWVLLDRPESSNAFVAKTGADLSFFPDVAGDYKLMLLIYDGSVGSQAIYPFTAE